VATYIAAPGYVGPDSFTYAASDSGGYVDSATPGIISVTVGPPETLATLDTDGDGISDLVEYALGLSPDFPSSSGVTTPTIQNVGGVNYLTLDISRFLPPPDATLAAEVSGDLLTWQPATIVANTPSSLKVRDPMPVTGSQHRFIRLRVTR
jgi:hypothetical protein